MPYLFQSLGISERKCSRKYSKEKKSCKEVSIAEKAFPLWHWGVMEGEDESN